MTRPDVTILPLHGKAPQIHPSAFIAPGCRIVGDVTIGAGVSIWYNCVIRADVNRVVIGARSNVQDGTVIHCDSPKPGKPEGYPTLIGEDVLIGHMAMVHGCTLHDRAFVGLGTIVTLLVWFCRASSPGDNRYGPNPLGREVPAI